MAAKKKTEFMIVNRRSKKALQATGLDNGTVVEQAAPTGSDMQLWTAVEAEGSVKIVNKANGKVLDVMEEGTADGTWAQTWEDVGGESQLWQIVTITATYKKLLNVRSGKVLDIKDMSMEDGVPAQIWEDVGGVGQQWKLAAPETAKPAKKAGAKKPAVKKAPAKKAAGKKTAVVKAAAPEKAELKKEPAKNIAKVEEKPKALAKPAAKARTKKTAAKEKK